MLVAGCGTSETGTVNVRDKKEAVTPVDKMRVRTAEDAPAVGAGEYRLEVSGLVENPISLAYEEIKGMNAEERLARLNCVEGWSETALWKGPRLADILKRAVVKNNAETVVFSSPGGYTTSLTIEDVKKTDPLLAYAVNGEILPHDQGFPVRLVVPGKFGYKWIKWVEKIELVEGNYKGYWEKRGYSNDADDKGR